MKGGMKKGPGKAVARSGAGGKAVSAKAGYGKASPNVARKPRGGPRGR